MPDNFQAEPPRWSSERPPGYDRYSEVNLRKPERHVSGVPWTLILVGTAFISAVVVAVAAVALFFYAGTKPPTVALAPAPAPGGPPPVPVVVMGEADIAALEGTWVATAATIDGSKVGDEDVVKAKLTMNRAGFKLVLPTTQKQGDSWTIKGEMKQDANGGRLVRKIDFQVDDGSTLEAIYEINDWTMKLCLSQNGRPRPTDFTAKKKGCTFLVLKRQGE